MPFAPSLSLIFAMIGIAAPFVAWGVQEVRLNHAVSIERDIQQAQCNREKQTLANEINSKADTNVALGDSAAAEVLPVSPDLADRVARCKQSPFCRTSQR